MINKSEKQFFDLLRKRKNIPEGESLFLEFGGKTENVSMEDFFVPARDGYQIPIRIFNSDIKTPRPILIMYPGGGYVMNMFEACAIACSRIAKYSGLKVILTNHRLVEKNPMPIPILDALDATDYIFNHAEQFALDPEKLVLGGFSAGAHCAAVISNISQKNTRLKINYQILLNGSYDALLNNRDYSEYETEDRMVSREAIKNIYALWGLTDAELRSPFYSPYYESNINQLPSTTIIMAEFDGMRSDSENYYQKLKDGGCLVSKILLSGQSHHTMLLRGALPDAEDPAEVIARIYREISSK